jgi:hypothetical protein
VGTCVQQESPVNYENADARVGVSRFAAFKKGGIRVRTQRRTLTASLLLLLGCLEVGLAQTTAELVRKQAVAPGVAYGEFVHKTMPWAIQVLEVDRSTPGIACGVAVGRDYVIGTEPLTTLARRNSTTGRRVIAAINADFFDNKSVLYQGDLSGLCVDYGDMLSSPNRRSVLGFTFDGTPVIERFQLEGTVTRADGEVFPLAGINQECPADGIVLLTRRFYRTTRAQRDFLVVIASFDGALMANRVYETTVIRRVAGSVERRIEAGTVAFVGRGKGAAFFEETPAGVPLTFAVRLTPDRRIFDAVGGGPRLLRDGVISVELEPEGLSTTFSATRHPRTAFGYNAERFFLVTVDGRQEGYSVGMTLTELAAFLKELGATDAMNLDGGGSTTMWVRDRVRNRPSDGRARPIGNAILVYQYGVPAEAR